MRCLYYFHESNWQSTLTLKLQTRWARDKAVANEKNGVKAWQMKTGGRLRFWQQHTINPGMEMDRRVSLKNCGIILQL